MSVNNAEGIPRKSGLRLLKEQEDTGQTTWTPPAKHYLSATPTAFVSAGQFFSHMALIYTSKDMHLIRNFISPPFTRF